MNSALELGNMPVSIHANWNIVMTDKLWKIHIFFSGLNHGIEIITDTK